MQLNLKRIDERIQKLQEIRRIAADPEIVEMLLEFMAEDDQPESMPAAKIDGIGRMHRDEATEIVHGSE